MLDNRLEQLLTTLGIGVGAYVGLVVILRVSGKRTLSKWNSFDFVVTIALGSALATVILSKQTPLIEGLAVLALLVGLQFVVSASTVRWEWIDRLVKGRPSLLVYRGEFLPGVMRRVRVTDSEIYAALRGHGITDVARAAAVVLETDGSFSVLTEPPQSNRHTLTDVEPAVGPWESADQQGHSQSRSIENE